MEVRQAIDDLKFSVEQVTAEDELLGVITVRVIDLRLAFRSHRSDFTAADIEFLKRLNRISDHLLAFVELKKEMASIESLKEYEEIISRLTRAKSALAGLPVGRRIAREICELNQRLPAIREKDGEKRRSAAFALSRKG